MLVQWRFILVWKRHSKIRGITKYVFVNCIYYQFKMDQLKYLCRYLIKYAPSNWYPTNLVSKRVFDNRTIVKNEALFFGVILPEVMVKSIGIVTDGMWVCCHCDDCLGHIIASSSSRDHWVTKLTKLLSKRERELIKTRLYPCLRLEMSWAAARVTQVRVLFSIITSDASLCFGSDGLFRMITLEISHRFIF